MAWVAFDRAVRTVETWGHAGPVERWRAVRDEIHADVCANGYDPELGAFAQSYGSKRLDASVLLIPLVGFLPPDDRAGDRHGRGDRRGHSSRDGLIARYEADEENVEVDGLPPGEGVFLPCSFWYAADLALIGRTRRGAERSSHGSSACATTSACSRRSTTRWRTGCSATSRRRSRI